MTVPTLGRELLSIDSWYRDKGYDVSFHQPPKWSGMERGDHKIPFRYDWSDAGWYMDYIPVPPESKKYNSESLDRMQCAYTALL